MTDGQRAPYPGLRAFRREETDLFFGREDSINAMVDRLAATRFLAVLGSSGTGKSSLVRTGLLDALELGLMAKAGSRWRIVDFRPGGAPLRNLACRLLECDSDDEKTETAPQDVDLLRALLARGPRSVIEWCSAHLPKGSNLLLLVDQFEELFRYRGYAGREEAEGFVALLLESAREANVPIYVAITMRSEYLGACALIEGLADAINAGMFLTPRMTRESCREAIVGPAAVCGIDIDPALVNRLLNDLANFAPWDDGDANDQLNRLMRRADQLPLLQYTLNRMWQRGSERSGSSRVELTLDDYLAIEGLSGALNAHANQIFEQLGKPRAQVAEWVFRSLTEGSTISDAVRHPTRLDGLIAACGGDEAGVRAVVDAFRAPGVNFLVPEYDPNFPRIAPDTIIDISHESLIRQWKKLSDWVAAEGRAAQQWRRLVDRFGTGEMLRGRELANLIAWRTETRPNAAWAKRYGGDYPSVIAYLQKSQRARTIKLVAVIGAILVSFALNTGFAIYAINQRNMVEANQTFFTTAFTDLFFSLQAPLSSERGDTFGLRETRAAPAARADTPRDQRQELALPEAPVIESESVDRATSEGQTRQSLALTTITILAQTARKLYESNPKSVDFQRLYVVGLIQLGDAKLQNKDIDGAEQAFNDGLTTVRAMLDTNPALWIDDHALALAGLGRVKVQRGELQDAHKYFSEAIEIEQRFAADQQDDRLLRNLQGHLGELGDLQIRLRETVDARKTFEERLAVRRRRLALNPRDLQLWVDVSVALDRVGQLIRDEGQPDASRKFFDQALKIDRELVRANPSRRGWQENLVFSLTRIGDIEFRLNHFSAALPPYEEALKRQRELAEGVNTPAPLQSLASILGRVGDIQRRLKNYPEAISAHQEELALRRRLLARDQVSMAARRSVSSALDYLGNALRESKDLDGARTAFTEQLEIDRGIARDDPDNMSSLTDLAWSLNRLGDLDRDTSRPNDAIRSYAAALDIQRKLYAGDPQNPVRMRALALILGKLGMVQSRVDDDAAALALHREELGLRQALYQRNEKDADALRDLSLANDRVGNALRDLKDLQGALKHYLEELDFDRSLVAREPVTMTALNDLQWTLNKIADFTRQRLKDRQSARKYIEDLVAVDRRLRDRQPDNKERHTRLRDDQTKLAELLLEMNDPAGARQTYSEVFTDQSWLAVARETFTKAPTDTNRNELASAYSDVGWYAMLAGRPADALALIEAALAIRPDAPWDTVNLGHAQMFLGRTEDAIRLFKSVMGRNRSADGKRTYADEIRDDLAIFRRLQLTAPDMERIERDLGL